MPRRRKPMMRKKRRYVRRAKRLYKKGPSVRNMNISRNVYFYKRTLNNYDATADTVVDGVGCIRGTAIGSRYFVVASGTTANQPFYGSMRNVFSLFYLPEITNFSGLYDSYRLRKVVVKIIPYNTTSDVAPVGSSIGAIGCIVHSVIDHDGTPTGFSAGESGIQSFQQYTSYKKRNMISGKPLTYVVKPKVNMVAQGIGTATVNFEGTRREWLDMVNTDTPHYGLYLIFEGINPDTTQRFIPFRMETTYYFQCKGTR